MHEQGSGEPGAYPGADSRSISGRVPGPLERPNGTERYRDISTIAPQSPVGDSDDEIVIVKAQQPASHRLPGGRSDSHEVAGGQVITQLRERGQTGLSEAR